VMKKSRFLKGTCAPLTQLTLRLAICGLMKATKHAKAPTWCASYWCFEPPTREFVLYVWPRWCARGHKDIYWFGQNVPTSSLRLLVLLALMFVVGVTN
jgi:hypothetical protein